jgi:hypothetical protein
MSKVVRKSVFECLCMLKSKSVRRKTMSSDAIPSKGQGSRAHRTPAFCIAFVTTFLLLAGVGWAGADQAEDISGPVANPDETKEAVRRAQELHGRVLDADKAGTFSPQLIGDIVGFYRSGSDDPVVSRKFCRDWVLALIADLFQVGTCGRPESVVDPNCPKNELDQESAGRFRNALTEFLRTAFEDLAYPQRKRLYKLAQEVFTAESRDALATLEELAAEERAEPDERALIESTIERIRQREAVKTAS